MIATALLLALATVKDVPDRCTLCHPDVRVEFERSVHRAEDVTCTACHGGDAAAVTVEAAHRRSFRGVPERRDIPRLCASCHSDVARMRPYNLPSNQFALYQTSTHGQKLAGGDDGVAVCTDCHGVHDILRPEDPASRVSIKNVPRTCARCHGDPIRMSRYGMRADAYSDYAASVHGRALLEQGNLSAPNCTRCHGSHGATPPGVGDVDKVCGQCHAATRSYFLEGPHKDALGTVGYAECASCHGHHQTPPAKAEMLDTVCLKCHAAKSAPLAVAARMKALYVGASEEIEQARQLVELAATVPLYVDDYRARLEEARTSLLEVLPVMHALDVPRTERLTARARLMGEEVESELDGKLGELKWRRVGLMVFWFYLLLTVAVLVRMRRRTARETGR